MGSTPTWRTRKKTTMKQIFKIEEKDAILSKIEQILEGKCIKFTKEMLPQFVEAKICGFNQIKSPTNPQPRRTEVSSDIVRRWAADFVRLYCNGNA